MKKKKSRKIKWMKLILRPLTIFKAEPFIEGWVKLGIGALAIPEKRGENWLYVDQAEFIAFGREIIERVKHKKNFTKEHIEECYKICESFVRICEDIGKTNLRKKSYQEIYKLFQQYYRKYIEYSFFLLVPISIEQSVVKFIEEEIGKVLKRKEKINLLQEYLNIFSAETKMIEVKKEEVSLLKIKIDINKNKGKKTSAINKKIDEHIKKYCWIPIYDVIHKPWSRKDFLQRLKEISEPEEKLQKIEKEFKQRMIKTKEAIEELKPNKKLFNMIEILQEYVFLRTYRTDALRKAMHYIQPLMEEIARRAKITKEEAAYMTKERIEGFLLENNLPETKVLRERVKHYLMLRTKNIYKIISNKKEIEEIINQELGEEKFDVKVLKGNIVYQGVVKGKVRIIKSIKDIGKLERGEILVTSMTTPDMTIAIHKAAAIVTDEGGITCHAAICSRELKIPCIVGTKIATKVLKDGDLVEVDATKGIAKKIK